jgi:hypothetical protein
MGMTVREALARVDTDPDDPEIIEAVEYAGQIHENVRHMRKALATMLVQWHHDNGGHEDD